MKNKNKKHFKINQLFLFTYIHSYIIQFLFSYINIHTYIHIFKHIYLIFLNGNRNVSHLVIRSFRAEINQKAFKRQNNKNFMKINSFLNKVKRWQ